MPGSRRWPRSCTSARRARCRRCARRRRARRRAWLKRPPGMFREIMPGMTAIEPTHLLSNGRYAVALRANGAGVSRWGNVALSRTPRRRAARRLRLVLPSALGSPAAAGVADPASGARLGRALPLQLPRRPGRLRRDLARGRGDDDGLGQSRGRHRVPPHRPAQLRRPHARPRADVVVRGDARRSARRRGAPGVLEPVRRAPNGRRSTRRSCSRGSPAWRPTRACSPRTSWPSVEPAGGSIRIQVDRLRWLGRNRGASHPLAVVRRAAADAAEGATASPSTPASIRSRRSRCGCRSRPRRRSQLTFCTAAADDPTTLRAVIDKYRQARQHRARLADVGDADRHPPARDAHQRRELRRDPDAVDDARAVARRAPTCAPTEAGDVCDRRLLWRFGISGDRPIVLVSAGVSQGSGLLRSLAQALRLWSWGGVACDLVVINFEPASYLMALNRSIAALKEAARRGDRGAAGQRRDRLSPAAVERPERRRESRPCARWRGSASAPTAARSPITSRSSPSCTSARSRSARRSRARRSAARWAPRSCRGAPSGDFAAAGGEFRFDVNALTRPARPWVNVLANPELRRPDQRGRRRLQLGLEQPPQHAHAVVERRRRRPGRRMVPAPGPAHDAGVERDAVGRRRRRLGLSRRPRPGLQHRQPPARRARLQRHLVRRRRDRGQAGARSPRQSRPPDDPAAPGRRRRVDPRRAAQRPRQHATRAWRRCAAAPASDDAPTSLDDSAGETRRATVLFCTQRDRSAGFGGGTAFFALAGDRDDLADWTCDRRELFDARGRVIVPDHYGQASGCALDPCAALSTRVTLRAGDSIERVFLLGYGASPRRPRALVAKAALVPPLRRLLQRPRALGRAARRDHGAHARPALRRDGQPLAALPDDRLPALGARRLLPGRRRLRLSRPAAGRDGARLDRAGDAAPADRPRRLAPVRRRRRPALVARADRRRRAHPFLRRPALAALRLRPLRRDDRRRDRARRRRALPRRRGDPGRRRGRLLHAGDQRRGGERLRALRARDRSQPRGRRARPAADGHRRLERRHEPGRPRRPRRIGVARLVPVRRRRAASRRSPSARRARARRALAGRGARLARGLQDAGWDGEWYRRAFFDDGTPLGSQRQQPSAAST